MNKILLFLVFSLSVYSTQLPQEEREIQIKVSFNSLAQMEMGTARPGIQPRSDIEACCDCATNPDQYIRIGLQTIPLTYLVTTVWDSCEQTHQTAFLPMVYASAATVNTASIIATLWQGFRESKFGTNKLKQD